jgi:outer membrane protein, heavy metal efflux system
MKTCVTLCFVLASFSVAIANTNRLEQLTLEQALQLAERRQPEIAEGKALVEAAENRAIQAGAFPNPEAVVRGESISTSGAEYLAGISQSVPLGSRLAKARQAELLERDRRAKSLEVRRRDIRKRVQSAFATALYQDSAFRTQAEIVNDTEKFVDATKARLEGGDISREDAVRAEMELARAKLELKRTEALREQAVFALNTAIGDTDLSVASLAGNLDAAFEIPILESLATNLTAHPTIALADVDHRVQTARIDLAKAERVPDVKVELLYRRVESERRDGFDIGLSFPLPLFDRNAGRVREARAEANAAEARSRVVRNEAVRTLRESHSQLVIALAAARSLRSEIIPRAETVLKAAESRYAAGDTSLSNVLPVRREWAAVQLSYLESIRDVMAAWANLSPFLHDSVARTQNFEF